MNEIASLLKRVRKCLKSAELLYETEDYESSVSRRYYAMFFFSASDVAYKTAVLIITWDMLSRSENIL